MDFFWDVDCEVWCEWECECDRDKDWDCDREYCKFKVFILKFKDDWEYRCLLWNDDYDDCMSKWFEIGKDRDWCLYKCDGEEIKVEYDDGKDLWCLCWEEKMLVDRDLIKDIVIGVIVVGGVVFVVGVFVLGFLI